MGLNTFGNASRIDGGRTSLAILAPRRLRLLVVAPLLELQCSFKSCSEKEELEELMIGPFSLFDLIITYRCYYGPARSP